MDDLAALVAAVDAAPDDDTPRLVFADWLDEHPEPEPCPCTQCGASGRTLVNPGPDGRWVVCPTCSGRGSIDRRAAWAELIRVQIELAKVESGDDALDRTDTLHDAFNAVLKWGRQVDRLKDRAATLLHLAAQLLKVTPDGKLLDAGPCPGCKAVNSRSQPGRLIWVCPVCSGSGRRRVPCVVERGWPVALLTLAEAVGGVNWTTISEPGATITMRTAPTTRTPPVPMPAGCGVRVTDREPNTVTIAGEASWYFHTGTADDYRHWLPQFLAEPMRGVAPDAGWHRNWDDRRIWSVATFPTRALALAALHAVVREFRVEHFKSGVGAGVVHREGAERKDHRLSSGRTRSGRRPWAKGTRPE